MICDNILQYIFYKKRSEADIVKATYDIHFIDPAKDVGGGLMGLNLCYIWLLF
jgi:hypothetical protein